MSRECARVGGINLGQGICDLPAPPEVLECTIEAVRQDLSTYSKFEGVDEFRQQIAKKVTRYNGRPTDPDREVVATIGSTGAFAATCQALFNPGDEVILFEPYYGYHLNTLLVSGCVPRFVTLDPPLAPVTRAMLEAVKTERTRAIVVCTPCNPSGKIFTQADLEEIAGFCQENNILAITDEIYEYILYDGRKHISLVSLPGMKERTVAISGFSKTFSITGWRLGYAVAPPELAGPIGLVHDLFYVCAPTPLQHGVARAMERLDDAYYESLRGIYQAKRDLFCKTLDEVGLTAHWPQGAYYVLADVSALLGRVADDREASMFVLENVGVASVPGSAFFQGDAGKRLIRFCFAKEMGVLEEACERLRGLLPYLRASQ
jgi:aminotransferase